MAFLGDLVYIRGVIYCLRGNIPGSGLFFAYIYVSDVRVFTDEGFPPPAFRSFLMALL